MSAPPPGRARWHGILIVAMAMRVERCIRPSSPRRGPALAATGVALAAALTAACQTILGIQPPTDPPDAATVGARTSPIDDAFAEGSAIDATLADSAMPTPDSTNPTFGSDAGPAPSGCASGQLACDGACFGAGDVLHCGSCANDCTLLANVSAVQLACVGGQCQYGCAGGYADCADAGTGCATYLGSISNCGACGSACGAGLPYCAPADSGVAFACEANCPASAPSLCGGSCVDEQTDNGNCGGCGNACAGAQVCHAGSCACLPCVLDQSSLDQCCLQ